MCGTLLPRGHRSSGKTRSDVRPNWARPSRARLLAKSLSPRERVREISSPHCPSLLSFSLSHPRPHKSQSAAISFIVQLVISAAITLLNTFNRQKIGSGSQSRSLSLSRMYAGREARAQIHPGESDILGFSPRKWRFVRTI